MAKSSSFFGLRRGSTKSLTFQVLDGKQITKDRVYEVRNPNTEKQRIQRVIMLTALRAYSAMQAICDHSYEGVSYGGKTQQAFMSDNLKAIRTRLAEAGQAYANQKAFTPIGMTNLAANMYHVSKGTLPTVNCKMEGTLVIPCYTSYAQVLSILGAEPGDQLTIMAITDAATPANVAFHFCRIILQPQDGTGSNLGLDTAFLDEDGHINAPNMRNEGTDLFTFIQLNTPNAEVLYGGDNIIAGTAILSRYENGKWRRSSQQMVAEPGRVGYTLAEAISTSTGDIDINDPYYLNGAGDQETEVYAEVASVKVNGTDLADGMALSGVQSLVITGSGLSRGSVQLTRNGATYVPATSTGSSMSFNLQQNGNYVLKFNGVVWAQFSVSGIVKPASITSVKWGSEAATTSYPFNRDLSEDGQVMIEVVGEGLEGKALAASNANISIASSSATDTRLVAVVNAVTMGDAQILLDGTLLVALTITEPLVLKYTLTLSSANEEQGTVSPEGSTKYGPGSRVTIFATPKSGFAFDKWSDNSTVNPRNITLNENKTLIATFKTATVTPPAEDDDDSPFDGGM